MKIIIKNLDYDALEIKPKHYKVGEVYNVIPYRYNSDDYYEVPLKLLSKEKIKKCPKVGSDKIFWIAKENCKKHDIFILPKSLFKI